MPFTSTSLRNTGLALRNHKSGKKPTFISTSSPSKLCTNKKSTRKLQNISICTTFNPTSIKNISSFRIDTIRKRTLTKEMPFASITRE